MSDPRERPVIFSGTMVRAILEGRKSQTRRVVKPQPVGSGDGMYGDLYAKGPEWAFWLPDNRMSEPRTWRCPYGVPGDRLWVRETFQPILAPGVKWSDSSWEDGSGYAIRYMATQDRIEWADASRDDEISDRVMPSIHMPRWASRILLEIESVRVERVQEISEEDARAEGARLCHCVPWPHPDPSDTKCRRKNRVCAFKQIWGSIHGEESWGLNPWVWVIVFRRVKP